VGLVFFAGVISVDGSGAGGVGGASLLLPLCVGGGVFLGLGAVILWVVWTAESRSTNFLAKIPFAFVRRFEAEFQKMKEKSFSIRETVPLILVQSLELVEHSRVSLLFSFLTAASSSIFNQAPPNQLINPGAYLPKQAHSSNLLIFRLVIYIKVVEEYLYQASQLRPHGSAGSASSPSRTRCTSPESSASPAVSGV